MHIEAITNFPIDSEAEVVAERFFVCFARNDYVSGPFNFFEFTIL